MANGTFKQFRIAIMVLVVLILLLFGKRFFISIDAGHVGVATLFGEVQDHTTYSQGIHGQLHAATFCAG